MPSVSYHSTSVSAARRLPEILDGLPGLEAATPTKISRLYVDTFDWALHRAGTLLCLVRGDGPGVARLSGPVVVETRLAATELPGFSAGFPPGRLRDAIAPLSTIRALLPMAEVSVDLQSWTLRDSRRKTLARVALERRLVLSVAGERVGQNLTELIRVTPIKGYERETRQLMTELEKLGELEGRSTDELTEALATVGRAPGDYSSKLIVELDPEQSAVSAVKELFLELLGKVRANVDGIRRDLDTEFLHDFRVSLRRTRTGMSQIRGVLPDTESRRFRREFSWLAGKTGNLRDLDVYLLKMVDYRELLPPHVRDELAPLEEYLRERRKQERSKLLEVLGSDRFRELLASWQSFLEGVEAEPVPGVDAGLPVSAVASREIRRAWGRALERGGKIDARTKAAKLHRLRIDCKKLRYLLEFFRSLAPENEVGAAIGALKGLQDNLGDFNDYGVQQEMLHRLAEEMVASKRAPAATFLAMGRLVERLETGQLRERKRFKRKFGRFSAGRNLKVFEVMLEDMERGRDKCE